MGDAPLAQRASFKSMWESISQDWEIITTHYGRFTRVLPDRALSHLKLLGGDSAGFAVDRLQHSPLTATLAQNGEEDEEYVVCTLLHDVGDMLGSWNHPDVTAAILKPFVSEANHWMVEKHGIFQGYHFLQRIGMDRNMRERFRSHPHSERTKRFIDLYDGPAFDPAMECLPLKAFEPMVRRVFQFPKSSIYRKPSEI